MFVHLDPQSDAPIYTQLKNQVIAGIAKKEMQAGDTLPSVRRLAADLGINLHTVNKAYQQLQQEGFILIQRQRGVMINPEGIPHADEAYMEKLRQELEPIVAESVCRGMTEKEFLAFCQKIYSKLKPEGENE